MSFFQGNTERINIDSPRTGTSTLAIVTLQLSVTLRQSSALRYHDVFLRRRLCEFVFNTTGDIRDL